MRRLTLLVHASLGAALAVVPAAAAPPLAQGPPEWKPSGRAGLLVTGGVDYRIARAGNTVVFYGATAIGGSARRGVAAVDVRTGKGLGFNPRLPKGFTFRALAASATTAYIAYFDSATDQFKVGAYDLRSGAELYDFEPTAIEAEQPLAMVYARGRLITIGNGEARVAAYDGKTGARVWQQSPDWGELSKTSGLTTDGERIFVGVPASRGGAPIAAFEAADGRPVPGWGAKLRRDRQSGAGFVYGLSGSKVLGAVTYLYQGQRRRYPIVGARSNGRPVRLPSLPKDIIELRFGTGRAILGRHGRALVYTVYHDPSGAPVGTIAPRYFPLAFRDHRRLLALEYLPDQIHSRIVELAPPGRRS